MSEIQVGQINSTDGSTAITTGADGYVSFAKTQIGGRRNLIINGAMQVAQRGTETTGVTVNGYFTCDRWRLLGNTGDTLTVSQSTDAPDGFSNSFKMEVTTADSSIASDEYHRLEQRFEGQDLQHLKYGTSSAESLTVSFWVKSSITGTYAVGFIHTDASTGGSYISKTYTINSANTWEYKTLTFSGQTDDVIVNDNTNGLRIAMYTTVGSNYTSGSGGIWSDSDGEVAAGHTVNFVGTSGATWQITGVQLEVGTVATPFEHRSYGEEMELCRRYYFRLINAANEVYGQGFNYGTYLRTAIHPQTTAFRALPSLEYVGPTTFYRKGTNASNNVNTTGNPWEIVASNKNTIFMQSQISDSEDGVSGSLYLSGTGCHVSFSAEL